MKLNNIAITQRKFELRMAKRHEKAILNVYIQLSKDIEAEFNKGLIDDVKKIVNEKFKRNLQLTLMDVAKKNVDEFVNFFIDKFKRTINFDDLVEIKSKVLKRFLKKYTAQSVSKVTDTTKKLLNDRITSLVSQGYSQKDIINDIVEVTKGKIGKQRAKIIARVETAKAFQITNYDTAVKAGLKYKTWWYIGGGKENRKYHEVMNGKKIPIKDKFDVGGGKGVPPTKMRFPKDPECLVAGQVINCTCQIIYS